MPWMVARTEFQRERVAKHYVELLGRKTYLPRFRDWRSGKIKSLYPNYLFVEYDEQWSYLRHAVGVLAPIFLNGVPGVVEDEHILRLQGQQDSEGLILLDLDIGHVVTVIDGNEMKGWTGIYNGMTDKDRCEVLFNIIGPPIRKIINTKHIRAESLRLI